MTEIIIKEAGEREAEQLAIMLWKDNVLRNDLGVHLADRPTGEDFLRKLKEWCRQRRATAFAILVHDTAIGTISLSHRSMDGVSARVGYWIGSDYRRQGYCTQAFAAVCAAAESEGVMSVSATIASGNIASCRIWERQGAIASEISPQRLRYELKTGRQPAGAGDA